MDVKWTLLANQVEAKLKKMQLKGVDLTSALDAMGGSIANRIRLGFSLSRDPWGHPWKPLNPAFRVGQPLRKSTRLMGSIKNSVEGQSAVVGTNVRYARVHQYGAKIQAKNKKTLKIPTAAGGFAFPRGVTIPARPFMPLKGDTLVLPTPWAQSALTALKKSMDL